MKYIIANPITQRIEEVDHPYFTPSLKLTSAPLIDLFINVRVTNNHVDAQPTILRFKFRLKAMEGALTATAEDVEGVEF